MTTWMEDPDGIAKIVEYRPSPEEQRRFEERADDDRYALLDGHVARGAIPRESCPRWAARLMEDYDLTAEVLADLPDDAAAGDRAYATDRRIRQVEAAYLDALGVETSEQREYDETQSRSEREYAEYAQALGVKA